MRQYRSNPETMQRAADLRKHSTPAEALLWSRLRRGGLRGIQFRRQHAIGPYIVDFCAPGARLIIEVDGNRHIEHKEDDAIRSTFLEVRGYHVLRLWDSRVIKDVEGVLGDILKALAAKDPNRAS